MCCRFILDSWMEHFCLAKPDAVFEDQDTATSIAECHLGAAIQAQIGGDGSPQEFALSLKHICYKSVSDFRCIMTHAEAQIAAG